MSADAAVLQAAGFDGERLQRIATWMDGYVRGKIPFAHLRVTRGEETVYDGHAGYADVEKQTPYTGTELVRIYSMSKPVTAVAYMQLEEQGLIHLDDPIEKYLPEFKDTPVYDAELGSRPRSKSITPHHLLTHTSGLTYGLFPGHPVTDEYKKHDTDFGKQSGTLEEVCKRLAKIPLLFEPGEQWNYGVSIDVLGRLVEVVSGMPFDRYLRENVFAPLGMTDTAFEVKAEDLPRLTSLYSHNPDHSMNTVETAATSLWADPSRPVTCLSGGGGLVSTMSDYCKFVEMLRGLGKGANGARILGARTVKFMTSNHLRGDIASMGKSVFSEVSFDGVGFGLGMYHMVNPAINGMICTPGEFGWGGLASTTFWVDPQEDVTAVFLTQLIPSNAYPIRRELRGLVYGALDESRASV